MLTVYTKVHLLSLDMSKPVVVPESLVEWVKQKEKPQTAKMQWGSSLSLSLSLSFSLSLSNTHAFTFITNKCPFTIMIITLIITLI